MAGLTTCEREMREVPPPAREARERERDGLGRENGTVQGRDQRLPIRCPAVSVSVDSF